MKNTIRVCIFLASIAMIFSAACKKNIEVKAPGTSTEPQASGQPAQPKDFSANFKFISKAENFAGKIFSTKDKTRMEIPQSTIITRADKNVVWVVMPGGKMYVEYPLQQKNMAAGFHKLPNEVSRKFIASEIVNGHKADKYMVTYTVGSNQDTIYQWIVSDMGMPIKTAAIDNSWSYEYDNVQPLTETPGMFEVPEMYKEFKMPSQDSESITHY